MFLANESSIDFSLNYIHRNAVVCLIHDTLLIRTPHYNRIIRPLIVLQRVKHSRSHASSRELIKKFFTIKVFFLLFLFVCMFFLCCRRFSSLSFSLSFMFYSDDMNSSEEQSIIFGIVCFFIAWLRQLRSTRVVYHKQTLCLIGSGLGGGICVGRLFPITEAGDDEEQKAA